MFCLLLSIAFSTRYFLFFFGRTTRYFLEVNKHMEKVPRRFNGSFAATQWIYNVTRQFSPSFYVTLSVCFHHLN